MDVIFFPSIPHIPPQFVHISYFLWLPQKSICLIILLLHLKSSSSFFLFLCSSFFFPSYTETSLPSFLTENSNKQMIAMYITEKGNLPQLLLQRFHNIQCLRAFGYQWLEEYRNTVDIMMMVKHLFLGMALYTIIVKIIVIFLNEERAFLWCYYYYYRPHTYI